MSDSVLHAGIESPVILLNPESTIRAVSRDLLGRGINYYLIFTG